MFEKLLGKKQNTHKVFVLGLDGARLEFINRPELPNFQKIISGGASGTLFSRPALTPAAWTSMVTGKNPGKHGIFDFRVGDRLLFSTDKKAKELWDYVPAVAINVPMTFPVKQIDGVMVTGMMSPDLDSDLVTPEAERNYLKQLDYVIEADQTLESIGDSITKRIDMVKHY
ncbi:alkaline phosphatase family protein, partial [candidate division WWE3 bacterium]|nr:alkaline phosphatase family protein [candidate division WWE3 bacterium]